MPNPRALHAPRISPAAAAAPQRKIGHADRQATRDGPSLRAAEPAQRRAADATAAAGVDGANTTLTARCPATPTRSRSFGMRSRARRYFDTP
jgi:hypothetical protein